MLDGFSGLFIKTYATIFAISLAIGQITAKPWDK
jgi:hypothetical protein